MAGEQPRIAGRAGHDVKDFHRGVGQKDMARLAGLGQRHDEQPQIRADILPSGLEDFAFSRPGQQKQAQGKGFRAVALCQRPHEALGLVPCEIAFPLRLDFEGRNTHAGRSARG